MPSTIGVPKETKSLEKRVGLTPYGVRALTSSGFEVWVQRDAGVDSGFLDIDYCAAGAKISNDLKELYQKAELIIKVKEPQPVEYPLLNEKHTLFCFLHLASHEACACVRALVDSGVTAIGYETLAIDGVLPLLKPMSEIAGGLSFSYGQFLYHRQKENKKEDPLTKDLFKIAMLYPSLPESSQTPISVCVWGGGIAGESALKMAEQSKGAQLILIEPRKERREQLNSIYGERLDLKCLDPASLTLEMLTETDLWIGCVHSKGHRAIQVVSDELLSLASKSRKKVIMDIAIDQGGNFPGSKTTFYHEPIFYDRYGNVRFCVANIPSFCGRYASEALEKAALPFIEFLAWGVDSALERNSVLKDAVNVRNHQIMIKEIREAHQL